MQIKFNNGKTFTYTNSFAIENDYINGITRKSLEFEIPIEQTSFNEIHDILNDENAINHIELVGDEQLTPIYKKVTFIVTAENGEKVPITQYAVDKDGNLIIENYKSYIPKSEYDNYTIIGKISLDNGILSFKIYRLSDTEIERDNAVQAVDELLLSMAESEA